MMTINVAGLVKKAAEKTGFHRERFDEKNMPTDPSRITVVPFFGDLRSLMVLSTLLLKRFQMEDRGSRYFILCSYPGFHGLFPYVDEYWGVQDVGAVKKLLDEAVEFDNKSSMASVYYRNLNYHFFEDVVIPSDTFKAYYNRGITNEFWNKYRHVKVSLPMVPSPSLLGRDFNRLLAEKGGYKVFIHPTQMVQVWKQGQPGLMPIDKSLWVNLAKKLLENKMVPVLWRSYMSHDLSPDLTESCIHFAEQDVSRVLGAMRACGCVLDVFNNLSRLAILARTPFLALDERNRYAYLKEFEIDDLCGRDVPHEYIFSFPTILEGNANSAWDFTILNNITTRLSKFLPDLNRDQLPPTGESTAIVPYDTVRKHKAKRIGTRLIKVPRD